MFRQGKVIKVKVELSSEVVGFGRATIVESHGSRLFLQLRTSQGEKRNLPKGTKIWFVSELPDNPFSGLWSTMVLSSQVIQGKAALECSQPKFEAQVQRRKLLRLDLSCAVRIHGDNFAQLKASTRNISRTGVGIEIFEDCAHLFALGHHLDVTVESTLAPISARGLVVQSRFNWLANKTDVGLEFVELDQTAQVALDQLLSAASSSKPRLAPNGKDVSAVSGQLATWLKSSKDNVNFIKVADQKANLISDEDLEELGSDSSDEHDTD